MAKIIVALSDQDLQQEIAGALQLKKHSVTGREPIATGDSPKQVAEEMIAAGADVAILDYLPDDAASVKMLQAVTDRACIPRFIFIIPEEVAISHILMAVNEGATAVLQKPINMEALCNNVNRAISGPGRFRHDVGREHAPMSQISEIERDGKRMRTQATSYRKLISYLMSTPAASQHRTAMVVSDSAYQRDYLKKLLENHGFLVFMASDSEKGLNVALEEKPRIVISDLEMEGKNGVEFCHNLKILHKYTPCHFVICTANSEKIDEVMDPGNGVDACVVKPSSDSDNLELIAAVAMGLLL